MLAESAAGAKEGTNITVLGVLIAAVIGFPTVEGIESFGSSAMSAFFGSSIMTHFFPSDFSSAFLESINPIKKASFPASPPRSSTLLSISTSTNGVIGISHVLSTAAGSTSLKMLTGESLFLGRGTSGLMDVASLNWPISQGDFLTVIIGAEGLFDCSISRAGADMEEFRADIVAGVVAGEETAGGGMIGCF